ncbi:hypothetical protein EDC56_2988 [Sinobacterium caligoides]|uniref:Uncharacterized protein n=1 Tax=Sinobacterium caligoides TaxID=933926 RepID=A0A3N2DKL7_9GAMM|nr:hypothetical protein [Sinobacterium caligoides]ROS00337.1 hypothetical protein EDC56_2988 [Sinobacterium caligoides]
MNLADYSDSTIAWAVYSVCALMCLIVAWRISGWFSNRLVRQILRIIAAAILMTPAFACGDMGNVDTMAPAFIILVMEFLAKNPEGVMRAAKPLLSITALGVSIAVVASIVRHVTHKPEQDESAS